MEISISSNSITGDYIDIKFGTCHDSSAVVPCAKFCSDPCISIWMRAKWSFHHIWIVMEKLLVKWAPGTQMCTCRTSRWHTCYQGIHIYYCCQEWLFLWIKSYFCAFIDKTLIRFISCLVATFIPPLVLWTVGHTLLNFHSELPVTLI